MINHILLPTDFSDSAERAADFAADLGRRYDASIDVVHAWTPPSELDEMMLWLGVGDQHERTSGAMAGFIEARSAPLMKKLLGRLESKQVRHVRGRLEAGQPSRVILDLADSDRYDLIVMASHGLTGMADVLIGSCVERVVRRSPIPVLVVPIPPEELRAEPWQDEELDPGWFGNTTH